MRCEAARAKPDAKKQVDRPTACRMVGVLIVTNLSLRCVFQYGLGRRFFRDDAEIVVLFGEGVEELYYTYLPTYLRNPWRSKDRDIWTAQRLAFGTLAEL